jgi:hypothetical protein
MKAQQVKAKTQAVRRRVLDDQEGSRSVDPDVSGSLILDAMGIYDKIADFVEKYKGSWWKRILYGIALTFLENLLEEINESLK